MCIGPTGEALGGVIEKATKKTAAQLPTSLTVANDVSKWANPEEIEKLRKLAASGGIFSSAAKKKLAELGLDQAAPPAPPAPAARMGMALSIPKVGASDLRTTEGTGIPVPVSNPFTPRVRR